MPDIIENFPPLEQPPTTHPNEVNDKAFYGASLNDGNPVEDYQVIKNDLLTKGQSPLLDSLNQRLKGEQDKFTRQAMIDIFQDENLDPTTKRAAIQQYILSGTMEKNLRDSYLSSTAARDTATSTSDREAQDIVIRTLIQREKDKEEEQQQLNKFYANLDSSKTASFLGILTELVPGLAGYNIAKLYDGIVKGGQSTTWERIKNSVWGTGSSLIEIQKTIQSAPLEKRKELVRKLIEIGQDLPGFDFQKWQNVRSAVEGDDAGLWENVGNIVGILDAVGIGWMVKSPVKSVKWLKPSNNFFALRVKPRSPAGTTATANPGAASALGTSAILDETGEIAKAAGTSHGEVMQHWYMPKWDEQGLELVPNLKEKVAKYEAASKEGYEISQFNPALYDITATKADIDEIHNFIKESEYPIYNQGSSTFNSAELNNELSTSKNFSGLATFGKTADYGFTSVEEATKAMNKQKRIFPSSLESTFEVKELVPGQWFIRMKWNRQVDPIDLLMFGENAVETSFHIPGSAYLPGTKGQGISFDVTKQARATGNWLWGSYDRLKNWVYGGATKSEFTERFLDQTFIKPLLTDVARNRFGREIGALLVKGGKTATASGGKVFTYQELLEMYPKHSVADVQEMYTGYRVARLMGDAHYNFANRLDRTKKALDGVSAVYDANGSLARYAKIVPDSEKEGLTKVFDMETSSVRSMKELEGRTIVKLDRAVEEGNNVYRTVALPLDERLGPLPARTLPYLTGYFPRQYKEFFWVDTVKKDLTVDGVKVTKPKEKANYRKSILSTKTEKEAREAAAEWQKLHPEDEVTVRPDRMDSEEAIVESYRAFSDAFQRARSRGDHIITGTGELAETEDPLVALIQSMRSISKRTAWAGWKEAFQTTFTKEYSEFLREGKFPRTLSDFIPKEKMSIEETTALQNAIENWKYYSDMTDITELWSDRKWAQVLSGAADILDDKSKWAANVLRESARGGAIPVRALQKVGTILFLFTNPIRQLVVQSQQLFELAAVTPSAIKDMTITHSGILMRMAADKIGGTVGEILKKSAIGNARLAGYSEKEFEKIFNQIRTSGIVQAVDSNMILHGMLNEADDALTSAASTRAIQKAKGIATAPIKIGKLGFDAGELMNMVGTWLWARKRALNAGLDVDSEEVLAQIAIEARRMTGSMTKTGAMEYQKGILAIPFQFASVGHKLFLQPLSARNLSAADKGKLFATRAVFYGAYGTGLGAGFAWLKDKYYDKLDGDTWDALMGGLMDWGWNNMLEWQFGKGPDLAVSPSLTPVSEYGLPYIEFLWSIMKDPEGYYKNVPLTNIVGRFNQLYYDLNWLGKKKDIDTPAKAMAMMERVLRLSSGYSNYMQAQQIIKTGELVDKFGNKMDMQGGWKAAVAKVLGFQTEFERAAWDASKKLSNRNKDLEKDAKMFHNTLESIMRETGTYEDPIKYMKEHMELVEMLDKEDQDLFNQYLEKEDKMSFKTRGYSLMLQLDKTIRDKASTDKINMVKRLADTGSVPAQELLNQLRIEGVIE